MRDVIPPAVARHPVEAVALASTALSDGDMEAAIAQYEPTARLVIWHEPACPGGSPADQLAVVMKLRLPVRLRVRAIVRTGEMALLLTERQVTGAGPDGELIDLTGCGATVVRRQSGGGWRIAADAWELAGQGRPSASPRAPR